MIFHFAFAAFWPRIDALILKFYLYYLAPHITGQRMRYLRWRIAPFIGARFPLFSFAAFRHA